MNFMHIIQQFEPDPTETFGLSSFLSILVPLFIILIIVLIVKALMNNMSYSSSYTSKEKKGRKKKQKELICSNCSESYQKKDAFCGRCGYTLKEGKGL